jgi:hypothetical protein
MKNNFKELLTEASDKDKVILQIAKKHFDLKDLKTRKSDSADFHDVAVWSIKQALEDAFEAGKNEK